MHQQSFDDIAPSELDARFWKFHKENPAVFEELIALAEQAGRSGRKRIGMKMLFEVIRWNRTIQTNDHEFKLNNSYTSRYARILVEKHPEFDGLFETRKIKS